jgi:DNA-directed RNA polymerase specialized sigma24 family protein
MAISLAYGGGDERQSHSTFWRRQVSVIKKLTEFDAERPRLTALAIRILGSQSDADDVLQDAWLRFSSTKDIEVVPAWLTTVVTRLCLDHLLKQRTRAQAEKAASGNPVAIDTDADSLLAEQMATRCRSSWTPCHPPRVAFVMHDVLGFAFDEISTAMGRSRSAVRQLTSRARRKVQGPPTPTTVVWSLRSSPPLAAGTSRPSCRYSRPMPSWPRTWLDRRWGPNRCTKAHPPSRRDSAAPEERRPPRLTASSERPGFRPDH